MGPLVSLIITTYNREAFLGTAIASVLQQTFPHFELLVWDDGSTDNSVALARTFAQQDARVRVIAAAHQGRVRALAAAIAQTQGTYLGWVDSDDWLAPTALEATVRVLNAHPSTGMVYTDYYETDAHGRVMGYGQRCPMPYSQKRLLVDFMTFHFRLLRRSLYQQVGGIDDSLDFVEDYDLCLRLSEVTQIRRVRQPLYFYRVHPQSASQQLNLEQTLRTHTILNRALVRRGMANTHAIDLELPTGRFILRRQASSQQARSAPVRVMPLLLALPLLGALPAGRVQAQSISPTNDGTNTVVTPVGDRFDITGGTVSSNGANLFHSFGQFGLTPGQIANFIANPQLQNILGRVVGNTPSVIDGLIQVSGGTPNLYLLNPAGILFGANASLNVPAAFTATTANAIGFGCGNGGIGCNWFTGTGTNNYAVLNGAPNGFAFSGNQLGAIANAGNLAVNSGQTLALLAGTIVNTGQLTAPAGQILLSAVPGQTLVRLSQPGNLLSLEFQPLATLPAADTAPTLAQLLTGGNLGNATGLTVDEAGVVRLLGSGISIPNQVGTTIASGTLNTAGPTGGAIAILGNQVGLVGAVLEASGPNGGGTVLIGGDRQGTGTLPRAQQTFISTDSTINANALQQGNGGRVIVWADGNTTFGGTINARGGAIRGDGGFVEVSGQDTLTFRGNVNLTASNGQMGTLLLDPLNITIVPGTGGANDTEITDGTIFAGDGGAASFTLSQVALEALSAATNIILEATNDIIIQPLGTLTFQPLLGVGAGSITFTAGGTIFMNPTDTIEARGRNITMTAGNLSLGNIDTAANVGGNIPGGNITLTATNGSVVAGNLIGNGYAASGGNITVTSNTGAIAVGQIESRSRSFIAPVTSSGSVTLQTFSNGGDITFNAIDVSGGPLFGSETAAAGGSVTIAARGLVRGIGSLTSEDTIAATGFAGGADGTVQIQHDGGPTNIPFVVGSGFGVTNGTASSINTGSEIITFQTFDFSSSPFVSPGGSIGITFLNDTPTINPITSLPDTAPNQPINFTVNSLALTPFDFNADNPLFVRVFAIAAGAILRINGVDATPGTVIPANATLQYIPPAGFLGTLANAFSVTIDDVISTSPPRAIALTVATPPPPPPPPPPLLPPPSPPPTTVDNPCVLTSCNPPPPVRLPPLTPARGEVLTSGTPEERFTTAFATYLGLPQPAPVSIDNQRAILRQIERDTGAKPAFVYVSFVPASINAAQAAGLVAGAERSGAIAERDDDQLEILVVSAQGNAVRQRIPQATRATVMSLVNEFRQEISDPRKTRTTRYLGMAQQLYRWMIAPMQQELGQRQINNLVFLMDTGLRSLPVAALHDGQRFLVEQYSIGLMPSVSLSDTRYQDVRDAQLLSLGISESTQGLEPLPSVQVEVATIVNNLWTGRAFLNEAATLPTLKSARQARPYGIIHLATHADFLPGRLDRSFIQLWEERLRMDQVRQLGWSDPQVQLLVLSACSTALGDREAELGFGGLAVQAGVKSAVASLWAVNDAATAALITRFYKDLQTAPIKAEALQRTQQALIRGEVFVRENQIQGVESQGIPLPSGASIRDEKLSHPYYWSSFTMIGSPW
ncbi:MAG: CHAT domain-containing protein [Leptolyngbyaceae cyanobacterium bins.349]|nr:CHAT domain-containing protein [Leptolyngbyaceae cyanobacterium bins.349]